MDIALLVSIEYRVSKINHGIEYRMKIRYRTSTNDNDNGIIHISNDDEDDDDINGDDFKIK